MAPMEKNQKVLESDPQKYSEEWFNMAAPTGKEFQLPAISNNSMSHVPCNNSDRIQLFNRGFAQTSQRNNNMGVGNTQIHLLSPILRPSPLRAYYGNSYFDINGLGAIGSAATSRRPLANINLAEETNFPVGNPKNPIFPSDHSTQQELKPNRYMTSQMGFQTEIPTFPGLARNYNPWSTSGFSGENLPHHLKKAQFHFAPHIAAFTPISFCKDEPPSALLGLDLLTQAAQGTPADLFGTGDASVEAPLQPLVFSPPEPHFCPVCLFLSHAINNLAPKEEPPEEVHIDPRLAVPYRFDQPIDGPINFDLVIDDNINLREVKRAPRRPRRLRLDVKEPAAGGEGRRIAADEAVAAPEAQEAKRLHTCQECYASFRSGNALGGHMSSHARKRKRDLINDIGFDIDINIENDGDDSDDDNNFDFVHPDELEDAAALSVSVSGEIKKDSLWAMF